MLLLLQIWTHVLHPALKWNLAELFFLNHLKPDPQFNTVAVIFLKKISLLVTSPRAHPSIFPLSTQSQSTDLISSPAEDVASEKEMNLSVMIFHCKNIKNNSVGLVAWSNRLILSSICPLLLAQSSCELCICEQTSPAEHKCGYQHKKHFKSADSFCTNLLLVISANHWKALPYPFVFLPPL